MENQPLLTIAIPTWNRASYLKLTLDQLFHEMSGVPKNMVEVLVSDNCSSDHTATVVKEVTELGLPIKYVRNEKNIGSDANIPQCFNLAQGKYVLILGDDDLLVDGAIAFILKHLSEHNYGVVCLRPYGFESDFRKEYPGNYGDEIIFSDSEAFLVRIGQLITLISACIINKSLLPNMDAMQFINSNLGQVNWVIRAILNAQYNLFIERYLVACKRNNSGFYDFSTVFVKEFGRLLDSYVPMGLSHKAILSLEMRMMIGYHPFYLLRQRMANSGDLEVTFKNYKDRLGGRLFFYLWLAPIIRLPRPVAIAWGAVVTVVGRVVGGDFRRGIAFAWNRLMLRRKKS